MAKQGSTRQANIAGLGQLGKQVPYGWTDEGVARGWLVPKKTPQDGQIKRLTEENQGLTSALAGVMARLEKLETDNGTESTG